MPDVILGLRVDAAIADGARMPRWGWPIPGPYNGATGQERVAGWQRLRVAETFGWLIKPGSCSICESAERIHLHAENYFRAMYVRPVCQRCHFCLHRRFRNPDRWLELVADTPPSARWARRIGLAELTREAAIYISGQADPWSLLDQEVRRRQAPARLRRYTSN